MKRALLLCVPLVGCIVHRHGANAPGHVAVHEPPRDLAARTVEEPKDPGERAFILQASATPLGVGWSRVGRGAEPFMPFSIELAPMLVTLEKSHRKTIAVDALDGAVRPNVGWTIVRHHPGRETDKTRLGPVWAEAQWVAIDEKDKAWGATLAAGVTTTFRRFGPQATACAGIPLLALVCGRASYVFGEGTTLQLGLAYQGFFEMAWSR